MLNDNKTSNNKTQHLNWAAHTEGCYYFGIKSILLTFYQVQLAISFRLPEIRVQPKLLLKYNEGGEHWNSPSPCYTTTSQVSAQEKLLSLALFWFQPQPLVRDNLAENLRSRWLVMVWITCCHQPPTPSWQIKVHRRIYEHIVVWSTR